jgi:hypothetical protein
MRCRNMTGYVALTISILAPWSAVSQQRFSTPPPPSGPSPRLQDGRPDLSGVWHRPETVDLGNPQMLPWTASATRERAKNGFRDSPATRCLPMGVSLLAPILTKFIQTAKELVIIQEAPGGGTIEVFIDGRDHPRNLEPTWLGHAIGKWDGDTLVVDRVAFNDRGWLSAQGHPRTEMLHVVDRIRRIDAGHLEIETTIDDSGTLAGPWTTRQRTTLAPGEQLLEFVCENNRYLDLVPRGQ